MIWKNRTTMCVVLIILLLLLYTPLIYTSYNGAISNSRDYWNQEFYFFGSHLNSSEHIENFGDANFLGNNNIHEKVLLDSWKFDIFPFPFINENMKNATDAYLLIKDSNPISILQPFSEQSIFEENDFVDGWQSGGGGATTSTNGDIVTISPDTLNDWFSYYTLTENFSSSEYDCLEIKVTNVDRVTWKLLLYVDETWWGLYDINGDYTHSNAGVFIYTLPPDHQYSIPTIHVENVDKDTSGTLKIDYIKIGKFSASNITVSINDYVALSEKLIFQKNTSFTLPQTYDLNFSIGEQWGWLRIPININSLKTETLLKVIGDEYTSWNISSVILNIVVRTADIHIPAWQSQFNYGVLSTLIIISSIIVSLILFRKLHKFIRHNH